VIGDCTLYLGDCLEILPTLAAGSVDAVVTDPPYYSITDEDWDKQWANIQEWSKWCKEWGVLLCEKLADNGSAYIFGDDKNTAYMQVSLDGLNWGLINNIVWSKTNYTALKADPMALRSYRVQAEERILFYGKDISFPSFSQIRNPKAAQPMAEYLRSERIRAGVSAREIAALFPSATGGLTGCVSNWELGLNFPVPDQY
jgi:site-specific DNA-methyltransferase (adenine-specific)